MTQNPEGSAPQRSGASSPGGQNQAGQNQGEGNREAAANFNRAEREFVESERGQQKIREGSKVSPGEQAEDSEAERRAAERAKAQDSNHM